jgi:mRNA-degrading endonuclease RelE of RelBE toxin-antitoxin system
MTSWTLHYSRAAVTALYQVVARPDVRQVTPAIRQLAENPAEANLQTSMDDPSTYWIAVPGDYVVIFEIMDEKRIVRILDIE